MTKGKSKAMVRRRLRKADKQRCRGTSDRMLGRYARFHYGDGKI